MAELFRENSVEYDRVNYFDQPLTIERLEQLARKLRLPAFGLLRVKERQFKELGLTEATPDDVIFAAIVANPGLLNRPIVETASEAVIARPIEKALAIIRR